MFVEFTGDSRREIQAGQKRLSDILEQNHIPVRAQVTTVSPGEMSALWEMRKRSVGLLAAVETSRVGQPFVEDAAVPPENLSAFVAEFGKLLNDRGLSYGMFGHADVGCVHVRPMLNMRDAEDRDQIRPISDAVSALCQRHGGLIWGEHGKGVRGEYLERYVGPKLYAQMRRIKAAFDPYNRLNPGKLVTAETSDLPVMEIDKVPMRGARDAEVDETAFAQYERALACNGNGACHNWAPDDPMCPSFKVTGDKNQGPKGRASTLREWARLRSMNQDASALEEALKGSLDTCLSCRSCSGQCPVQVDIPAMKSAFLNKYYESHTRPMRDRIVLHMEQISLQARKWPRAFNLAMSNPIGRSILSSVFGLIDVPKFSTTPAEQAAVGAGARIVDLDAAPLDWGNQPVCILLDSFTGVYETMVIASSISLLGQLGHTVWVTPPLANGKARQVRGLAQHFEQQRSATTKKISRLVETGVALVSLEPAVTDLFWKEYQKVEGDLRIWSLENFLFNQVQELPERPRANRTYTLFLHCTEKTVEPETGRRWQGVFDRFGLSLDLARTGCCGMAGLFGYEAEHQQMSRDLFDLSWRGPLKAAGSTALATGFSCRSQARRFAGAPLLHPAAALLFHI